MSATSRQVLVGDAPRRSWPARFARLAAVLAAVQGMAHGTLFILARPRHGAAEVAVVAAMQAGRFFAGGLSYWDYYFGYGLVAASACLVEAGLLWQLGGIAQVRPSLARPMLRLIGAANIGHAILLLRYFRFPLPIAFDLIIAGVVTAAVIAAAGSESRAITPSLAPRTAHVTGDA